MSTFLLNTVRSLILDMDGVLWRDSQPIFNLHDTFLKIKDLGIKYIFVTNNSTRSPEQYQEKLHNLGVPVEKSQIITSPMATAYLLKQRFPQGGPVFLVGEKGLSDVLAENGYFQSEDHPLAVIAGLDRTLTYEKLAKASLLIRNNTPFIGTNPDRSFPSSTGLTPGAGAILALLEAATDVHPEVVGKPNPGIFHMALEVLATPPEKTLVIGDRLDTDILGGQSVGCKTALVLSGVSTLSELDLWSPKPDLVAENMSLLFV